MSSKVVKIISGLKEVIDEDRLSKNFKQKKEEEKIKDQSFMDDEEVVERKVHRKHKTKLVKD